MKSQVTTFLYRKEAVPTIERPLEFVDSRATAVLRKKNRELDMFPSLELSVIISNSTEKDLSSDCTFSLVAYLGIEVDVK